jgi:hypothetical protein
MKKILILVVITLFISIGFNVLAVYERFSFKTYKSEIHGWLNTSMIKDKKTGVCYLVFHTDRYSSITAMYDSNGKILVEK